MITVAYLALAPFISGSERCLQLILTNAKEHRINPILITPSNSPMKQWAELNDIVHHSVNIDTLKQSNPFLAICNKLKLMYLLKKNKVDIVHSNQIWSLKVVNKISRMLGIRRVCHFRDPINEGSKWWLNSNIDAAIFISNHIQRQYEQQFTCEHATKKIKLIDPVKFNNQIAYDELHTHKQNAKLHMNISEDVFTFGYIGQIAKVKGVVELLQTLSKVKDPNWQLIIAGKDPSPEQDYLQKCRIEIKKLGIEKKVKFIGFVDDTHLFYLACDVIVMFSHKEPLGLIPLEAAVNYTPAIANRVGGLPETIIDNKTGWLVNINTVDETIKVIESSMNSDLHNIGKEARAFVEDVAKPQAYMAKLEEIYLSLL